MKQTVHQILGIKPESLSYNVDVNFHACVNSPDQFLQASEDRVTSKQRVDYVFKYLTVGLSDSENESKNFCKNSTVAGKLRERGNDFYKKKELAEALKWYNVALMFAPRGDQEAGLAYANRSAVLVELRHPEEALADVELALLNNYPKASVCKLESRRRKCTEMIKQRNAIQNEKDRKVRIRVEEEVRKREKMREEMVRIANLNPRIPEAANFVTIEYDQVMGRKLVVTKDVPAGTVLMVCDPYVTVLNNEEGWHSAHCHHCLKRIRRGIPCENCVFAFYCNERCKQEAHEEYHKFECPCMSYIHGEHLLSVLAFRVVCKAGPKKLFQLYRNQDPAYFNPKKPYGTEDGCKFGLDPYLAVYHMMAHSEKFNEEEEVNVRKTCSAVALASILESRSAFFQEIPTRRRTDFKKFVAAMIRHHTDSSYTNPTPVYEMSGLEGISLTDFYTDKSNLKRLSCKMDSSQPVPMGMGMYALDSLKNHSCDPNIFFVDDVCKGRKINIASRALKAGDVMCGSYDAVFTTHPLDTRQQTLKTNYHFTCECVACVNKWPTFPIDASGELSEVVQFCCPACSVKYSLEEKASPEFQRKCGLNEAGSWKCRSCDQQYCKETLQELLAANKKAVREVDKLAQYNRLREAIAKLPAAVEFHQNYLCPPTYNLICAGNVWYHAVCLLFHFLGQ